MASSANSAKGQFALVFDPNCGIQLLDTSTNEVLDVAVIESSRRKVSAQPPAGTSAIPVKTFGSLRIRSAGAMVFDAIVHPDSSGKGRRD
jgi:hypothetical protein